MLAQVFLNQMGKLYEFTKYIWQFYQKYGPNLERSVQQNCLKTVQQRSAELHSSKFGGSAMSKVGRALILQCCRNVFFLTWD